MLFNSHLFIFLFLPVVAAGYFFLNGLRRPRAATIWLTLSSLAFYGVWDPADLPLFLASLVLNYGAASLLGRLSAEDGRARPAVLAGAIMLNLAPLLWYKYSHLMGGPLGADHPRELPAAISFFTFQQIAFLADTYLGKARGGGFHDYCLFTTFFPRLISGPILRYSELEPQLERPGSRSVDYKNVGMGLLLFSLGLFKKTVLADRLAVWAGLGFSAAGDVTFVEAWLASLSYTLQIYFDFSGYTDMALGAALILNIRLPANFDSPYKAETIQDFWRRWHMSLSRWFLDYLFMPLQLLLRGWGAAGTAAALMATFLACGIWHGVGWTFIVWGLLHGLAILAQKGWQGLGIKMPRALAWFLTFQFVNLAWVFFRADSLAAAFDMLKAMAGLSGFMVPASLAAPLSFLGVWGVEFGHFRSHIPSKEAAFVVALLLAVSVRAANSNQMAERFRPDWRHGTLAFIALLAGVLGIRSGGTFLYFGF